MIVRPRLNDYYDIPLLQSKVDFAIPFINEDIPLYVDPFLLWKSPSQMDNGQHLSIVNSFNRIGQLYINGEKERAINLIVTLSECDEVGLGTSKTRKGKTINPSSAIEILSLYESIPQIQRFGISHIEILQLLVSQIGVDRISDFACSLMKSFLIDYTIQQCRQFQIPMSLSKIALFDHKSLQYKEETLQLPINEASDTPIILVPKRWLRHSPYITFDSYFDDYLIKDIEREYDGIKNRVEVLTYNRAHFDAVEQYVSLRERMASDCKNDPLFAKLPANSIKRKFNEIIKLPTGKTDNADKKYEDLIGKVLSSLLFPHLDFATEQSRVESGSQIRDLIFYNNTDTDFLEDIYKDYQCRQIVIEIKNVKSLEREHINQLNRYMSDQFGKFGIIFTRNAPSKEIIRNTIDLWSGQRRCILIMTDEDLRLMTVVNSSNQRQPIEVIKKKYIEFTRLCPN